MSLEERKDLVRKSTKYSLYPETKAGGQSAGLIPSGCKLVNEDVDFEIIIAFERSHLKNKILANTLFELYLDEVLK
jgi:hypothetical protein